MSELVAMVEINKTPAELERDELVRQVLEGAARKLENQSFASEAYQKAFKTAARAVREMKP
jgi:hypothetical protein